MFRLFKKNFDIEAFIAGSVEGLKVATDAQRETWRFGEEKSWNVDRLSQGDVMKAKVLSILLSLVFLASGGAKLAGLEFEVVAFERWGYPLWFMYVTGAGEVAGGIGLLVGRLSALAGAGLAMMMIGAVATHVIHAEWAMLVAAAVILALSATRAWIGSDDIRALGGRGA